MVISLVSKKTGVVIIRTPHKMLSRLAILPAVLVLESREEIPGAAGY